MLRLILGRSGSGKSHFIKTRIEKIIKEDGGRTVLIVPEQSSFDNERELLKMLGEKYYGSAEVFSFTRLAQRLPMLYKLSQAEGSRPAYNDAQAESIDAFGKIMLMSRALITVKNSLRLFARQIRSTDFMQQLINIFAEFKSAGIRPEDLAVCAERMGQGVLRQKLTELGEIYGVYGALFKNRYMDAQDMLEQLAGILKRFDYFSGKTVFVDSFGGFTCQESQILDLIMRQSDEMYVALTADRLSFSLNDRFGLFYPSVKTARDLIGAAKRQGVSCAAPVEANPGSRFKSAALAHLEQGLFDREKPEYDGECEDITLYSAVGAADEVEFAARSIRRLAEDGMRYRDMVVMARDISSYEDEIETVFARYDIPVFMDRRASIECTPLFFLVLSALDIASNGFDSDSIFKFLKSGLTDMPTEDISLIENYTLIWHINGSKWLSDFKGHPDGLGKKADEDSSERLSYINSLRKKIIAPLLRFRQSCTDASGSQIARAVYDLLLNLNVPEALQKLSALYSLQGEKTLSDEQDRLWQLLMDILDRAFEVSGDDAMDVSVFAQIIRAAINSAGLGHIPQTLDSVTAGSAERMKPNNPKAVFILGANDGVFPRTVSTAGLFSEYERKALSDADLRLDFDLTEDIAYENLLVYQSASSASEKLSVSFQSAGLSGEIMLPSVLVSEITRLFPRLSVESRSCDPEKTVFNDKTAFGLFAETYREDSVLSASLLSCLSGNEEYAGKLNIVKNGLNKNPGVLSHENAARLFERNRTLSSTKIESFYKCRYNFLFSHGLKIRKRESGDINALMFGTILHYCLEHLMRERAKDELVGMSSAERNRVITEVAQRYCDEYMGGLDDKPTRFRALYRRWINNCRLVAANIVRELSESDYSPTDFELRIGHDIPPYRVTLKSGESVRIIGSVDRVDTADSGGGKYLRIIDYKSGQKIFSLSSVVDGLDMQMLIYLFAILKNGGKKYGRVIPAGVLYLSSEAASSSFESFDEQKALEVFSKNLRMNGLLLDDKDSILMMEYDGKGRFIPVSLNSKGEIKRTESAPLFTAEQLSTLQNYVDKNIKLMAEKIKNGDFSPDPIETGRGSVCDWCDYKTLCAKRGLKPRERNSMKNDECYEYMQKSLSDESAEGYSADEKEGTPL
ncbi:MAG: exodeoxyribonuclease V subunit gamma [Clostridia bacterium]|nr:exodeoxyribonuclease V subunit gamma [Clostridia bacterium]